MSFRPLRSRRPSRLKRYGSLAIFVVGMALVGFLAQFQWVGYIIILGYIVYTFIRDIPARTAFVFALLALGMVPLAIVFSSWTIAGNFAAYSFILLVFGVILTTLELQREPRRSE
ncbi:MAG TPA: hypothetical protein VFT59_06090 [Candidatus Saccharimonadales bacterium]|nr:hypothetical protein [Candidatus Saccharimonadales bacterium]